MKNKRFRQLFRRRLDAHKGDFGHILIVAGSLRYSGAGVLASAAALRCGAGLVTLGMPKSLCPAIIKIKPKEVMLLPLPQTADIALAASAYRKIKESAEAVEVLALGPGLSQNKSAQKLARALVSGINKPMVIDADGLNALVGNLNLLREPKTESFDFRLGLGTERSRSAANRKPRILTPHPGEMARLLGTSVKSVQAKRKEVAKKFAQDHKVTLVLKGHWTVVASPEGRIYINKTGNPGMASAGSGDVLAGMIAAFLGQGLRPFDAARHAVYIHGLAGDLAAKEKTQVGMIASDIVEKIPEALKKVVSRKKKD